MHASTSTTDLATIEAAQEALSRLTNILNPAKVPSGSAFAQPMRMAETSHSRKSHSYIKWPPLIRPRVGGPWKVLDLCKAYNFPTNLPGGGVIGILELDGGWTQADLDKFSQLNGLPAIQVTDVSVDGTQNAPGQSDADGEVALDIQVAAAAYYYATGSMPTIKVFWAKNDFNSFAKVFAAAADAGCDVLSISWGADEVKWQQVPGLAQQTEAAAQDATARGCILFAAAGDNSSGDGDPGANVDLPSACPHVIGCGGTAKTAFSEKVWGDGTSSGNGTGGGFSNLFPVQSWQIGVPSGPGRMVPDVAADADPSTGYFIVLDGQEVPIGGTSAVAPFYAGLFASFGKKLGFVTPTLYQNPKAFVDITEGSNGSYQASPGPDPCTGLGVPNGASLAALFTMTQRNGNGFLNRLPIEMTRLETFRTPAHANVAPRPGEAAAVNVSAIVGVASHTFTFKENSNTPGRQLEQSVVITVPSGAGFFTCIPYLMGSFTSSDFQHLTERPLGQFYVSVGLRGNNLVCSVRLTDSNSDDPIFIEATATVVFYN